jgi:hypothetical protein
MIIKPNYEHRNLSTLLSFVAFCYKNPKLRFWQALVVWANYGEIDAVPVTEDTKYGRTPVELHIDTFYWEGRSGNNV